MSDSARRTEISARSPDRLGDAAKVGVERAAQMRRAVTAAWIEEQQVSLGDGRGAEHRANLLVGFGLE